LDLACIQAKIGWSFIYINFLLGIQTAQGPKKNGNGEKEMEED
jgi:hypothetical protein